MLKTQLRISVTLLSIFTILTGVCYPLLITGIAQVCLPDQANGSLLTRDGRMVGSSLIGQPFTAPSYFWSRPSATGAFPYNAGASSGSNLGPTNPALRARVHQDAAHLAQADSTLHVPIPVDLVTTSASGLDPHISPAAAHFQVPRVARARGISEPLLQTIVDAHTEGRFLGILGEPRVNVLTLNLALDSMTTSPERH